jgi:endonuclease YncB( thermonuclease family)
VDTQSTINRPSRTAAQGLALAGLALGAALLAAACLPIAPPGESGTPAPWPTEPQPRRTPLPLPEPTAEPATAEPTATRGPSAFINHQKAHVLRVWDGQSVLVENGLTVRYLGVQAPSAGAFGRPSAPGGVAAAQRNAELVEGKEIELEQDATDVDADGQLPRYVYVDGEMVNRTLLEEGLIQTAIQPPDTRYEQDFLAAEQEAWGAKRGVWVNAPTMTRTPVVRPRATLRPAPPPVGAPAPNAAAPAAPTSPPSAAATPAPAAPRFGGEAAPAATQPPAPVATAAPRPPATAAPAPAAPPRPATAAPVPAPAAPAPAPARPPAAASPGAIPRFGQ